MITPPKSMTVHVTQEDIDKGVARDCHTCPIARAVARKAEALFPLRSAGVSISSDVVIFLERTEQVEWHAYTLSKAASEFIYEFDKGREVKPQKFVFKYADSQAGGEYFDATA